MHFIARIASGTAGTAQKGGAGMVSEANVNFTAIHATRDSTQHHKLLVTLHEMSGYGQWATCCMQNMNICPKFWLTCSGPKMQLTHINVSCDL